MDKIKKNWKEILIVLLLIFGMNKCTTSCNRGQQIKKQSTEISTKDSTLNAKQDTIKVLVRDIEDYRNQIMMLKGFSKEQMRADSLNRAQQAAQTKAMNNAINQLKNRK